MVARENLTRRLFTAGTQNKDQTVEYHERITGSKNEAKQIKTTADMSNLNVTPKQL